MLEIKCDFCGKDLEQPGALVFGPPTDTNQTTKYHVCGECYPSITPDPQTRVLRLDLHDACIFGFALSHTLKYHQRTFALLELTRERDLTAEERVELPDTLKSLNQHELREQIDAWYSLLQQYEWVIKKIETMKAEIKAAPKRKRVKREQPI